MTSATGEGSMRLKALELQNFRGFKELRLQLPEDNLAVLVGVNGAGKSTVLDAVAFFLERFVHRARRDSLDFYETQIGIDDIRRGASGVTLSAMVEFEGEEWRWSVNIERARPRAWKVEGLSATTHVFENRLEHDERASVPVLCAYPAIRGMHREVESATQTLSYTLAQFYAYEGAFARERGPFQGFVRWFRLEEDLENETRARSDGTYQSPRLQAVRAGIERFMSELSAGRFSNLRAERAASAERDLFAPPEKTSLVVDKSGERLALEQLSEGERITLLLVADLAWRLSIANPSLPDPLTGSGIVLIDEVDLHLHPQWQRAVLPGLRKAFPNLQFIVTTHSPQVLSRVPSRNVILLKDFQVVGATPPTFGRDANSILEEVMALPARPEEAAARIAAVSRLIDDGKLDEARRALADLSSWLGTSDDPEVVRLGTLIDFLTA